MMPLVERYVTADATGSGDGTSPSSPWTLSQMFAGIAAGQRANVLIGTYTRTANDTQATAGTRDAPIVIRGVRSFAPLTPTSTTRLATWRLDTSAANMPLIAYGGYRMISAAYTQIVGLRVTSAENSGSGVIRGARSVIGCAVTNANASYSNALRDVEHVAHCDLTIGGGIGSAGTYACRRVVGCRIAMGAVSGSAGITQGVIAVGNVVVGGGAGQTGIVVYVATDGSIVGNTVYLCATGLGVLNDNSWDVRVPLVTHNIIHTATIGVDYQYHATAVAPAQFVANCLYNCGTNYRGFGDWPPIGDIYADPQFVDAANGDYRLRPGSPAAGLGAFRGPAGALPSLGGIPDHFRPRNLRG